MPAYQRLPRPRRLAAIAACVIAGLWASACLAQAAPSSIPVDGRPFAAEPSADGSALFVSLSGRGEGGGAVAVLRRQGEGFAPANMVKLGGEPSGLALSRDDRLLAVAASRSTVLLDVGRLMSGADDPVVGRYPGEAGAIEAAFTPDDRLLAISEERAASVTLVDLANPAAPPRHLRVGNAPVGMAISQDGRWLYVTSETTSQFGDGPCPAETGSGSVSQGSVSTIDLLAPGGPAVAASSAVGCAPVRIVLSADGAIAFVSLRTDGEVAAFLTEDLRAGRSRRIWTAPAGPSPVGLALAADGRTLLVANSDRFERGQPGSVSCLHLGPDSRSVSDGGKVASGVFPREAATLPGEAGFVVTLFGSHALQLLPARCPAP